MLTAVEKNKTTGKIECRFKFPFEFKAKSEVVITNDRDAELLTARNDKLLNKYNDYVIQTWRANIDVSPVLSRRALVNYLAKYITKSEKQSKDLTEVLKTLMHTTDGDAKVKKVIQRLYIQSCSERDFSAQETCHLLMGTPLTKSGGRKFVTLNFKALDPNDWVPLADDDTKIGKSYIEKYMERSERFEGESLMSMAKKYVLPKGQRHPFGLDAIVQVYPRLSERSKDESDAYFRQQVLLHVPWRYEDQLLDQYESWEQAYIMNETLIRNSSSGGCDLDNINPDDPDYEELDIDETDMTEQFMYQCRMGPSGNAGQIELGRREIDVNHNWNESLKKYDQYGGLNVIKHFIRDQRKCTNTSTDIPMMPTVDFTREQQTILNLLKLQIRSLKEQNFPSSFALPRSVIVQGKAGKLPLCYDNYELFFQLPHTIFFYRDWQELANTCNEVLNLQCIWRECLCSFRANWCKCIKHKWVHNSFKTIYSSQIKRTTPIKRW